MKGTYYTVLTEKIETQDEMERLMVINSRIDKIVFSEENPRATLRALICLFEGNSDSTIGYSIMALAYSVLLGAITLLAITNIDRAFFGIILLLITGILIRISVWAHKREVKHKVILSALRFRYEIMSDCKECTYKNESVTEYIVQVEKKNG